MKAENRSLYDRYLRQLRAGGRTNMYGAVPYLMKAFGLDRETAFSIICRWLDQQVKAEPRNGGQADRRTGGRVHEVLRSG
jgi:hypothetical protein